ncbi:MAG: nicotinamide riboside transporter PnuC [Bacteroidota bacterium]
MNWLELLEANWLECTASVLGAISVWFVVKRNIWAFPIGIVMVLLYIIIFYEAKFYSDMILQIIYVVMQMQGWYLWSQSDRAEDDKITIDQFGATQWRNTGILQVLGTIGLGYTMHRFTDAALPWVDAFTTTMSLLAQWWMNKKYLENWLLWIAVDVIYLYQYSAKQLYLTTGLYAIFLFMAIIGYREWKGKTRLASY